MSDWISVKDKLPNFGVVVLVWGNFGYVTTAERVAKDSWEFAELMLADDKITHWMPLPSPPKPTRKMAVLTVPHYNS